MKEGGEGETEADRAARARGLRLYVQAYEAVQIGIYFWGSQMVHFMTSFVYPASTL